MASARSTLLAATLALLSLSRGGRAFTGRGVPSRTSARSASATARVATTRRHARVGNLHGDAACFLPVLQNDEEYIAPRTVQVRVSRPPRARVGGGLRTTTTAVAFGRLARAA